VGSYPSIVREIRSLGDERSSQPRDEKREAVRDMRSLLGLWNLPDGSEPGAETRHDDVPIRIDSSWLALLLIRSLGDERSSQPRDEKREAVRDMRSLLGKLNLDETEDDRVSCFDMKMSRE
jgi:hypothetical protein